MTFIGQYYRLKAKLLYRNFELGMLFWIIPLLTIFLVIFGLINYCEFIHSIETHLLLINSAFLLLIQQKRNDVHFLKSTLTKAQVQTIFILDNFSISLPFIILAIGAKIYLHIGIVIIILWISLFPISKLRKIAPMSLFKKWNIEWNSSFRIYGLAPLATIGLYVYSFFLPTTAYLNIFLFGICILSLSIFQNTEENLSFIRIFNCSTKQFIYKKLTVHLTPLLFVSLLTIVPILITESNYFLIILTILFQVLLFNINTILGKYANYENKAAKLVTFVVKLTFSIIPFLLPLNLILAAFLYKKAITSLNTYLHVDN